MLIVLLNVPVRKELSSREYCILISELRYANPRLSSSSENKVNTTQGKGANLQQGSSAADASITRLMNTLSSSALIGHSQRAELDSAANSSEKHYKNCDRSKRSSDLDGN
jgi:hypothetical protein